MISHQYRCIFIHIPKCAGTSIERAFGHLDKQRERNSQDHRSVRMIEQPLFTPHVMTSKENMLEAARRIRYRFRKHVNQDNSLMVSREQYSTYLKFAFVRNPWSRAYSWYNNVMIDEIHMQRLGITEVITLNEFLHRYRGKGALRPQTHWIKNYRGAIPLDYIGRFENLQQDFAEACKRMGIKPMVLPHETKGPGSDYRAAYDDESIDMIRETYREEIALFGYSFEC